MDICGREALLFTIGHLILKITLQALQLRIAYGTMNLLKVHLLIVPIVLPASLSAVSRFRNSNYQYNEADANETTAVHGGFPRRSSCLFWI